MRAATMASAEQLLAEFRAAWTAGQRPRVEDYLDRVDPRQRAELVSLLEGFLQEAPGPEYSEEVREAIRREPAVQEAVTAFGGSSGMWPSLLPRLRKRARLRRDEVVALLVKSLGLPPSARPKARRYLHAMEAG